MKGKNEFTKRGMRLYDEGMNKSYMMGLARDLKKQGVEKTKVKKKGKMYQLFIGGKGSEFY